MWLGNSPEVLLQASLEPRLLDALVSATSPAAHSVPWSVGDPGWAPRPLWLPSPPVKGWIGAGCPGYRPGLAQGQSHCLALLPPERAWLCQQVNQAWPGAGGGRAEVSRQGVPAAFLGLAVQPVVPTLGAPASPLSG